MPLSFTSSVPVILSAAKDLLFHFRGEDKHGEGEDQIQKERYQRESRIRLGATGVSATPVTTLELRAVEAILEMGNGYVLDFSDRTFSSLFKEYGVDIDSPRYSVDGTSKAKRLRCFLNSTPAPLTGRVLSALLEHRLARNEKDLRAHDLEAYAKTIARLGGQVASNAIDRASHEEIAREDLLLRRVFKPEIFKQLPLDAAMNELLLDRMNEAQRCIESRAFLAAVILCGSVLEGLCLGYGSRNAESVNRGYLSRFGKSAGKLPAWRLMEWIDVLGHMRILSPNIEKFSHGLRDFRNYVHPAEQLAHQFAPDQHTARIGFQVVIAAAEDFVRTTGVASPSTGRK